jgi:uncharacterized protein YegJ (DUF2314 family)
MRRILVPACVSLLLLSVSCTKGEQNQSARASKEADRPGMFDVSSRDEDMDKAIMTARSTVGEFLAALKSPKAGQSNFSVKKEYRDGKTVEHIWLTGISFDGKLLHGVIDNAPVDVTNVKAGDKAAMALNEISDWMYTENGKLKGGYTIRVYYNRQTPEGKSRFVQETGLIIE